MHDQIVSLLKRGKTHEAIALLKQMVAMRPNDQALHVNLACAYEDIGQLALAEKGYRWIISVWPQNVEAASNLGNLLARLGRSNEAATIHQGVLTYKHDDLYSMKALALVQCDQGKIEEAVANLKRVAELSGHPAAWSEYLSYGLHIGLDVEAHKFWADRFAKPMSLARPHLPYDGKRQIRLGYVSNTWDRHSVSAFIVPILQNHSDDFHVTLFSDIPTPDIVKNEADEFVSTQGLNPFQFGAKIRQSKIDILVDLDGHKRGGRLLALASHPAPVVGTMNGYLPNTYVTEDFNRGWAFRPHDEAPAITTTQPADRNGFVTFGSFNRAHKITQQVARAWAAILAEVPTSRLAVAAKGGEANTSVRERLEAAGVPADRLTLLTPHASTGDYLAAAGEIDIHLDPFPFSGVSITCDLLYQGVPSVTFEWTEPQGHSTADILRTVGLDDLVAQTEEGYIKVAASLASGLDRLRGLRADLRARLTPLLDGKPLTKRLETLFRERLNVARRASKPCGKCQRQRVSSLDITSK